MGKGDKGMGEKGREVEFPHLFNPTLTPFPPFKNLAPSLAALVFFFTATIGLIIRHNACQ